MRPERWSQESQANYEVQLTRLQVALRAGETAQRLKQLRDEALLSFEALGYPDDWSRWDRAYEDARMKEVYQ
jgi:hypothetical protein